MAVTGMLFTGNWAQFKDATAHSLPVASSLGLTLRYKLQILVFSPVFSTLPPRLRSRGVKQVACLSGSYVK